MRTGVTKLQRMHLACSGTSGPPQWEHSVDHAFRGVLWLPAWRCRPPVFGQALDTESARPKPLAGVEKKVQHGAPRHWPTCRARRQSMPAKTGAVQDTALGASSKYAPRALVGIFTASRLVGARSGRGPVRDIFLTCCSRRSCTLARCKLHVCKGRKGGLEDHSRCGSVYCVQACKGLQTRPRPQPWSASL